MPQTDRPVTAQLGFEEWANVFTEHQAFSHPSELHGVLCGRFAAGGRINDQDWLSMVCEHMGVPLQTLEESPQLAGFMAQAYADTLQLMQRDDLSFHPLLPDDDYPLEQQLQALSAWIRGFLEGMALVAGESLGNAPDEIRELIEDMVAISQVSDAEEDSEEGNQQLTEIIEYVRLGALAVFTEFNEPDTRTDSSQTLH
ncbi:UPF0149 family protein [Marinobacter sp. X15-166B]|uniref:UPF0149 family protein n=1 Tax=Marinobacter sp. X15-166B TaxID=1897620 RepID=UPI00085CC05E|nr:UPF0149 family protein [Marinobacter sp. X15-166B]OEY65671.1 hypothetical protein BG841_03835 [Marinobacter sp. X15-166B]